MPNNTKILRRLSTALFAWFEATSDDANTQPPAELADELADAVTSVPPELLAEMVQANPASGMPKLLEWAQRHHERRKHARFFALLKQLNEMDPNSPEHVELFWQAMLCAPRRYVDAAHEVAQEYLPQATHVNEQGQPIYSVEQIAQHVGKPVQQVHQDVEHLIDSGLIDANSLHTGKVYPLQ